MSQFTISTPTKYNLLNADEQDDIEFFLESAMTHDLLVSIRGEDIEADTDTEGNPMPDGEMDTYVAFRGFCALTEDDYRCYQNGGGEMTFVDPKELRELLLGETDADDVAPF